MVLLSDFTEIVYSLSPTSSTLGPSIVTVAVSSSEVALIVAFLTLFSTSTKYLVLLFSNDSTCSPLTVILSK